jgi:hypothetical protein
LIKPYKTYSPPKTEDFFYQAFISYSRKDRDFAMAIQHFLEREYKKLKKEFKKTSVFRIARDEEDFTAGVDLGEHIKLKLSQSKHLIIVCSRNSQESSWVNKEVQEFIDQIKARDLKDSKIIPVIIDGDNPIEETVFPKALAQNGYNPISADFRLQIFSEVGSLNKRYLRTHVTRTLLAAILDINYSEFINRQAIYDKIRRRKQLAFSFGLIILIAIVLYFIRASSISPRLDLLKVTRNLNALDSKSFFRNAPTNFSNELVALKNGMIIRSNDDGSLFKIGQNKVDTVKVSKGLISDLCLFNFDKSLAVCGMDTNAVILHDIESNTNKILDTTSKDDYFYSIDFSERRMEIAYGSSNGIVHIYNLSSGKIRKIKPLVPASDRVEVINYSNNNDELLIAYHNGTIFRYNLRNNSYAKIFNEFEFILIQNLCGTKHGYIALGCEGKSFCSNKVIYFDNRTKQCTVLDSGKNTFDKIFIIQGRNFCLVSDWVAGLTLFDLDKNHKVWYQKVPTEMGESQILAVCMYANRNNVLIQTQSKQMIYAINGLSVFSY